MKPSLSLIAAAVLAAALAPASHAQRVVRDESGTEYLRPAAPASAQAQAQPKSEPKKEEKSSGGFFGGLFGGGKDEKAEKSEKVAKPEPKKEAPKRADKDKEKEKGDGFFAGIFSSKEEKPAVTPQPGAAKKPEPAAKPERVAKAEPKPAKKDGEPGFFGKLFGGGGDSKSEKTDQPAKPEPKPVPAAVVAEKAEPKPAEKPDSEPGFFGKLFGGDSGDAERAEAKPEPKRESKPAVAKAEAKPAPNKENAKEEDKPGFFAGLFGGKKDESEQPKADAEVKPKAEPKKSEIVKAAKEEPAEPESKKEKEPGFFAKLFGGGSDDEPAPAEAEQPKAAEKTKPEPKKEIAQAEEPADGEGEKKGGFFGFFKGSKDKGDEAGAAADGEAKVAKAPVNVKRGTPAPEPKPEAAEGEQESGGFFASLFGKKDKAANDAGEPQANPKEKVGGRDDFVTAQSRVPFFVLGPSQPGGPDLLLARGTLLKMTRKGLNWSAVELKSGELGVVATNDLRPAKPSDYARVSGGGGSSYLRRNSVDSGEEMLPIDSLPGIAPDLPTGDGPALGNGLLPPLPEGAN
ncbi:MAG: hypothetical protein R3F11_09080 [Verrucomicrobiales bacterium]